MRFGFHSLDELASACQPETGTREKMSKSRGNVVTVDEVTHGVSSIDPGYEFRVFVASENRLVPVNDFRLLGVWRERDKDGLHGYYFTSNRIGKIPVFLCRTDDIEPPSFPWGIQHPDHIYWGLE